ncbi:ABC transporter ATP-binding protein [Streptomyces bathyalis]|uniref:ABC transporter ATP-binding protein n=1 Tax=Streptomyces bathyalis TaxID=2710756 RepID=A0A7T1T7C1_9ACTN|nr:ABC transporter ATP-binding protein [Streptomyces bathyalis]QPP07745.1 ABC transporter ATP-binding protein [Streptomyces bathyalis]
MSTEATTTAPGPAAESAVALEVTGLTVRIDTARGPVVAVDDVGFRAHSGETLALLGESGCGKSITAQAIAGLLDPVAEVSGGEARLGDVDLLRLDPAARRATAGPELAIVFQDALTALNPVYTVGTQLAEPFRIHQGLSAAAAHERAVELMRRVGIPEPENRAGDHPHQFSGGMRQRLLIAMAVALGPRVLLADEPTTALDVTVQAQIMELLRDLRAEHSMAVVLITHDLALVSEQADRVAVMYAGAVVETGPVHEVFGRPLHPYTRGLLDSVPSAGPGPGGDGSAEGAGGRRRELASIPGAPPDLHSIPSGCVYQDRCPLVRDVCRTRRPALEATGEDRTSACHFWKELEHG